MYFDSNNSIPPGTKLLQGISVSLLYDIVQNDNKYILSPLFLKKLLPKPVECAIIMRILEICIFIRFTDSLYGKNEGRTKEAILNKITRTLGIVLFIVVLVINIVPLFISK